MSRGQLRKVLVDDFAMLGRMLVDLDALTALADALGRLEGAAALVGDEEIPPPPSAQALSQEAAKAGGRAQASLARLATMWDALEQCGSHDPGAIIRAVVAQHGARRFDDRERRAADRVRVEHEVGRFADRVPGVRDDEPFSGCDVRDVEHAVVAPEDDDFVQVFVGVERVKVRVRHARWTGRERDLLSRAAMPA